MHDPDLLYEALPRGTAKIIADLDRRTTREETGLFRIEGWRGLSAAVSAQANLDHIVVRLDALNPERMALLERANTKVISRAGSKGMSRLTSVLQDQGVVATARMTRTSPSELSSVSRILALDGVQDPGNVGTLLRTAAWFGVDAVIAGKDTADFYNPKVVRAAAGSVWDLLLSSSQDLAEDLGLLQDTGFQCFGADISAKETPGWEHTRRSVIVLGNEGRGLSKRVHDRLDGFVHLPARKHENSGVESLNVATAGGILIAMWSK